MQQEHLIDLPDLEWIAILRNEVAKRKKNNIAEVAREIGMPRPSLSLLLNGNYPARLDKVSSKYAAKVIAMYSGLVWCPHIRASIGGPACMDHRTQPMPKSDPEKLKHWVACRSCPQNPDRERNADAV